MTPPAGRTASTTSTALADDQLGEVRLGLTRLGRLLSSRRVHAGMANAARVTLPEQAMNVLRYLGDRDPLPVGRRAARMDAGAVSRQVKVLVDAGLVERRESPQHGSIVLVVATPEGRETARRFEQVRNAQLSRALSDWTDDEREQLGRLLLRLVDDLQSTPYQATDGT